MKIGFISASDSRSKYPWSGTIYYTAKALEKHCGEVIHLGPVPGHPMLRGKITNKLLQCIGLRYDYMHDYTLARTYARYFTQKISHEKFDVLIACAGATEVALLDTPIPIVGIADITSHLAQGYYKQFSNLLNKKVQNEIEQKFLDTCSAVLYSSEWAASSARKDYKNVTAKIETIEFGANIDDGDIPTHDSIVNKIQSPLCRLLFIGVDWERKGGDIAFRTLLELLKRGVNTSLTVCGCIPPKKYSHPQVTVIPFLNKNNQSDRLAMNNLYMNSDFLFVPTRKEAYGIVFCEAAAFGLPAISTATGGVTQIIKNDINGYTLHENAQEDLYASTIERIWLDKKLYFQLVQSSRNEYNTRLNWDTWGKKATAVIHDVLKH